jgi:hypothetical protein
LGGETVLEMRVHSGQLVFGGSHKNNPAWRWLPFQGSCVLPGNGGHKPAPRLYFLGVFVLLGGDDFFPGRGPDGRSLGED